MILHNIIRSSQAFIEALGALPAASVQQNIFGSREYLTTCAEHVPPNRQVYCIEFKDDSVTGIAPLSVERELLWRRVRSLASGHSDYEPVTIANDQVKASALVLDHLKVNTGWDYLSLWDLRKNEPFLEAARKEGGLKTVIEPGRTSPQLDLSEGFDAIWGKVQKNIRMDTDRQMRRLEAIGKLSFDRIDSDSVIDNRLDLFFDLHVRRWNAKGVRSQFEDRRRREFFHALAHRLFTAGTLDFRLLTVGDAVVAAHFGFVCGGIYHYYIPTFNVDFNRYSAGRILLVKLIQSACSQGLTTFDFLVGDEEYKTQWPVRFAECFNVYLYNATLGATLARFVNHTVKPFIKSFRKKAS